MKFSYLCLAIIIALIATSAMADQAHLKAKFGELFTQSSEGFDFSSELKADVCKFNKTSFNSFKGADWIGTDPSQPNHYKYTLTFCDIAAEKKCAAKQGSLCQYDATKSDDFVDSLASFTSGTPPAFSFIDPVKGEESGYQLTFTNGPQCWGGKTRTVLMKLTCDKTNGDKKFNIIEPSDCTYEIDIASKFACGGSSSGISGGAIILIIFFSVLAIYFIVGCIICVAKFGKPFGLEACPQKDFWCSLPGLYIAGLKFTGGKIAGCCGSKTITSSSGEYEQA